MTTADAGAETGSSAVPGGFDAHALPVIAQDTFSRTTTSELGTAEKGGAWITVGAPAAFAVSEGAGRIALDEDSTRRARLTDVATDDADLRLVITTEKVPSGTAYLSALGRAIGSSEYRCRLIIEAGMAKASISRVDSDDALVHLTDKLSVFAVNAGEAMGIRCQAAGHAPTTLRMKLWRTALGEPADWTLTASDTTATLQSPGTVGVHLYMGTSANGRVVVSIDDLLVHPASRMP